MSDALRVLDLFSGIGGFSLGLERAGMRTVAFCEIEPFCRRVLAKHWPGVPCYDDVRTLTAERLRADGITANVICGGFPCQDVSAAGKQAGLAGERSGLWSEITRLARDIRPDFVIVENVTALLSGDGGGWFGSVLGDLAALGFDAEWHCIPASAVGAPHQRDRVWIVAHSDSVRRRHQRARPGPFRLPIGIPAPPIWDRAPEPAIVGVDDDIPHRVDRLHALGNAVVPQVVEIIGRAIVAAHKEGGLNP